MNYNEVKPVFEQVEGAMEALGIDYYLIGALARDIWYERIPIQVRATKDVDFAILIGSHDQYETIKSYLIDQVGYSPSKNNAYVLISPEKYQVDLLPFGNIADSGSVLVQGQGMTSIKVDGMQEVYERGTEKVSIEEGHSFKAATIASITLLKLIAYDDRPEAREKDATDIGNIITHFFELHRDMIYDQHLDLYPDDKGDGSPLTGNWDVAEWGTLVLGRSIGNIASCNDALYDRLIGIIEAHLAEGEDSQFVRIIAKEQDVEIQQVQKMLGHLLWGLHNPVL